MISAKDIKDRESLEQWLEEWPASQGMDEEAARKVAVSIAHRAAMRVFPFVWEWSVSEGSAEVDVTSLPVLRCLLIAVSSCFEMTHQSKKIAHSAADHTFRKYKTDWSSYFALNAHAAGADAAAYASFTSSDVSQLDALKLASSAVDPSVGRGGRGISGH